MPIPVHAVHIYQKPKLGNGFIRRLPVFNYTHEINAIGGFDSASFDIALGSIDEAQQFLDQYLGNRFSIYVDNPVEPCWEGFINRMTFSAGEVQYTISLDEMANRIQAQYINNTASLTVSTATIPTRTTVGDDTNSQALYGIKEEHIDLGQQGTVNAGSVTTYNNMRDNLLVQRAWPKASITRGQGSGLVHVEGLGFYHTLSWEVYVNATATNLDLDGFITTLLLPAVDNGTTFFDNTDFTDIITNTATISQQRQRGGTIWDVLQELQEYGNATSGFVIGISPTLFQTGTRRFYYREFNSAIEYTARQSDGLRVRDKYGKIVPPWTVRPDRGIRVNDMLIGYNGIGDNPTETYISAVTYDANSQQVDWRGADDTTLEGVMHLKHWARATKSRLFTQRRML